MTQIATEGGSFSLDVPIAKVDEAEHKAFGWAKMSLNPDGSLVVDRQGDVIHPEDLEATSHDYMLNSRDGGDMHVQKGLATVIESVVLTPEKVAKMGLPESSPIGWWVGFKIHDDQLWTDVASGRRPMLSIHGRAVRKQV